MPVGSGGMLEARKEKKPEEQDTKDHPKHRAGSNNTANMQIQFIAAKLNYNEVLPHTCPNGNHTKQISSQPPGRRVPAGCSAYNDQGQEGGSVLGWVHLDNNKTPKWPQRSTVQVHRSGQAQPPGFFLRTAPPEGVGLQQVCVGRSRCWSKPRALPGPHPAEDLGLGPS